MPPIGSFGLLAVNTGVEYWYWLGENTYKAVLFYCIIMVGVNMSKNNAKKQEMALLLVLNS